MPLTLSVVLEDIVLYATSRGVGIRKGHLYTLLWRRDTSAQLLCVGLRKPISGGWS